MKYQCLSFLFTLLANKLADKGIVVNSLLTFDPHIDNFFGIKRYKLNESLHGRAVNFFQRNTVVLGPNTFRGGTVDGAVNIQEIDSVHTNIVRNVFNSFE